MDAAEKEKTIDLKKSNRAGREEEIYDLERIKKKGILI